MSKSTVTKKIYPLLATIVFSIAATQVRLVMGSIWILSHLLSVYVAFLIIAALDGPNTRAFLQASALSRPCAGIQFRHP